MRTLWLLPAAFTALTLTLACGDESNSDGAGSSGAGNSGAGAGQPVGPSWWGDVAPIVYANCLDCHVQGGIAPLALTSYQDAKAAGYLIVEEISARRMPPFHADNSGACNTYKDARWLSDAQIATITDWFDANMPEGDPADAPAPPAAKPALDRVDATLDIGGDYLADASLSDDYRCFVIDPQLDQDMFITGYHVKPGDDRVVHHVIIYALGDQGSEQTAEQLDAAQPGLGYRCFGGTEAGSAEFVGGWAPGTPVTYYPEGTGLRIAGNRKVVVQIHYNNLNGNYPDHTTIDLKLAATVAKPAIISSIANHQLALPPGQALFETSNTIVNPANAPVLVHGMYPHMHELGKRIDVSIAREGGDKCMVDIPDWDFHWQQFYLYNEPLVVYPQEEITITCGYNTLNQTNTVTWGEGTQDEMCLSFLYVTAM